MSLLQDISVGLLVSRLIAMLFFSAIFGFAMAGFARLLGDRRPLYEGRFTLNPFAHLAVPGALIVALFGVGWIRTMRFDVRENRWGIWGVVFVPLAAIVVTLLTIPLVDLLRMLSVEIFPQTGAYAVIYMLLQYQSIALASCVLNLLPVPGLAGGAVWAALRPQREKRMMRYEPVMLGLVAAAIVAGFIAIPVRTLMPYFSSLS